MIKRIIRRVLGLPKKESKMIGGTLRIGPADCEPRETLFTYPNPWENTKHPHAVSSQFTELAAIKTNEFFTRYSTDQAVSLAKDWYRALAIGGRIEIDIPENAIRSLRDTSSTNSFHLFAALLETDPSKAFRDSLSNSILKGLLEYSGFVDVDIGFPPNGTIHFSGTKTLDDRERQVCPVLQGIRADHRGRYLFALEHLPENANVLDVACGIGYGAKILSSRVSEVVAVDLDRPAIGYAERYYNDGRIAYKCEDALNLSYNQHTFDGVCSFETIEHVPDASTFVQSLFRYLKKGGVLICSTPNQETMPYSKELFPFHVQHFHRCELESLLLSAGFEQLKFYSQHDRDTEEVTADSNGLFHVTVARKPIA